MGSYLIIWVISVILFVMGLAKNVEYRIRQKVCLEWIFPDSSTSDSKKFSCEMEELQLLWGYFTQTLLKKLHKVNNIAWRKSLKLNLRRGRNSQKFQHISWGKKNWSKIFLLQSKCLRFYQLRLVCTQNTLQIFSRTTWFGKNACSPKLLPKPAIFLHRYFPEIWDILQPWSVALVTVDVKSAFVADSAASPQLSCYEEETEGAVETGQFG